MYLHEERPLLDYPFPLNTQPKNYAYYPPEWKDAVYPTPSWDGARAGGETELTSLPVQVSLQGRELWDKFSGIGTEMLITKTGRRMFPCCKVTVTGLNPRAKYVMVMDMVPFDDNKYKWNRDRWEVNGTTEPHLSNRFFIHPDSPALGDRWMEYPISFHKLKLTNNTLNSNGLVILHSMHKYQPRLHIVQSPDPCSPHSGGYLRFTFPEAAFIAVTAYQNSEITKLKIDNNPFAKGFRDSGLNRKRFREKEPPCTHQGPVERRHQIGSENSHASRPVDTDDGADVTVSSSVDSLGALCMVDDTATAAAPISNPNPNPFISAFMNRGGARLPCGQEGQWPQSPRPHNTVPFNTRDYGRHNETRPFGLPSVSVPLSMAHTTQGQPLPAEGGLGRPPSHGSRTLQQQHSVRAPDHTSSHVHSMQLQQPQRRPPPQQQPYPNFDHPLLPLPPKVSRMQLPESALRCLEMTPDPSSPRPLADILNRIQVREAVSGSPGKAPQLNPQHEQPCVGTEMDVRPLLYPSIQEYGSSEQHLPLHSVLAYQSSMAASSGVQARDGHVDYRAAALSLERPGMRPLLEFYFNEHVGK